jgi:hypothetical protein
MALSTKDPDGNKSQVLDRKAKIAQLKDKHKELFRLEGVGEAAKFIPKMAYIPRVGKERVIALFPSEIQGGEDVYTEFVSAEYDPEDSERTLWKWPYNAHWDTEYEKTDPHPTTGHCRYLIPVDELVDVASLHQNKPEKSETETVLDFSDLPDPDDDAPLSKMTMRDKCAIDWKLPVSRKPWLNELIRQQNFNQK